MPRPGDAFDQYVVEALIGVGGMGEVYLARDERLERKVALKILTGSALDPDGAARLLREARAAAALDHPHVVSIFGAGESNGVPYIAMEYVAGTSLRSHIGDPALSLATRLRWLIEIAGALRAAHRRGIVHRDLKPENVLVHPEGHVKVLDFGIARRVPGHADALGATAPGRVDSITGSGAFVGTPLYASPEQLRGEPADGRSDQFSWAVVAYELLTGRVPWGRAEDPIQVVASILSAEPRPPRELAPSLTVAQEAVVRRALAKTPADRFPSMNELLAALAPRAREPRAARVALLALGALAAVGAVVALGAAPRARPASSPLPAASSIAAPPHPTTLADLPPPDSKVPEAAAEYAAGMQALRDDSWPVAFAHFDRAAKLDPSMALAHMRAAMTAWTASLPEADLRQRRDHFAQATALRERLSERDRVLLEALEPDLQRFTADRPEALRRLRRASERYPLDAEIFDWIGELEQDPDLRLVAAQRSIELDPLDGQGWETRGKALADLDQPDAARDAFEHCVAIATGATDCLNNLVNLEEAAGECSAAEEGARRLVDREPRVGAGILSSFALGEGRAATFVRELQMQAEALFPEDERNRRALIDRAALSLRDGDFTTAERLARAADEAAGTSAARDTHEIPTVLRAQALLEIGDLVRVRALAREYAARSEGFLGAPTGESLWLVRFAVGPGGLSPEALDKIRSAALASLRAPYAWTFAYAAPALTRDDAERALEKMSLFRRVSPFRPTPCEGGQALPETHIGHAYLLAGRAVEALPHLRRAAAACAQAPFWHVHAVLDLGHALEATGDALAACEAYGRVVAQWGPAAPRSTSVEEARARMAAMTCTRGPRPQSSP